jgi:CheY-like chemotaxis protein
VRRLARLLGGDVHVADRTDGVRGVRFRLRLPLRQPLPEALVSALAVRAPATQPESDDARAAIRVRRRVLLVDDSAGNRRLVRRSLEQLGCFVVEAHDGDEVVRALMEAASGDSVGSIDVVLMDIEMPRLDGVAAVREMRAAGWHTPVVAMTGHAGADNAAHCKGRRCAPQPRSLSFHSPYGVPFSYCGLLCAFTHCWLRAVVARGFNAVLPKPFSRDQLRDVLLAVCRRTAANTNTNTKYTCDTGQTRNKLLAQWVHLTQTQRVKSMRFSACLPSDARIRHTVRRQIG